MKKLISTAWLLVVIWMLIVPPVSQGQTNCLAPAFASAGNATTSSIQLSWTAPAGASFFNVRYRLLNSTIWTQVTAQLPSYNLTGLNCGGVYEWQVQSVCSNSGSSSVSPFGSIGVFTILPCGSTCAAPTGLNSTNIGLNQATLSWISAAGNSNFNLRYRNINSTNWIVINNVNAPFILSPVGCNATYIWQVQAVCANTTGSSTLSAWSASSTFNTLPCPGSCLPPTTLASANITSSSATVSWNAVAGALSYTVRYRVVGSLAWIHINANSTSKNLLNLYCNSNYQWQVRANCSPVSNSYIGSFSQTATFTTLPCPTTCATPTGLTVSNVTGTSATLSWNIVAGATGYIVQYHVSGSPTFITVNVSTNSAALNNLSPSTSYSWQVRTVCGGTSAPILSPWSPSNSFQTTTANTGCNAPTITSISSTGTGGVTITWAPIPGAIAFNIRYRPSNTNNWTTTSSSINFITISNLIQGTAYEFQFQTVCPASNGAAVTSAWSPSMMYTVPLIISIYPNPANDDATVSFISDQSVTATLEVRNLSVIIIYSQTLSVTEGENSLRVNTASLNEGLYNITIITGQEVRSSRMMIQR